MIPLGAVYGQITRLRRRWYTRHPQRQRYLDVPVISVGNLTMGGSGKTPVVAALATLLYDAGYAPAILSRGYKRRGTQDIAIASDGHAVVADVDATGDEPQMLARRLRQVPVVVSADRYRAGRLAVARFGARVLILDDAFQHLQVARTVNLLLLTSDDTRERVFPAGRLREPLDAVRDADAILVPEDGGDASALATRAGVSTYTVRITQRPLQMVVPYGAPVVRQPNRVVALSGIARPGRFVDAIRRRGCTVVKEIAYRDHHWFTEADVRRAADAAAAAGAEAILTTEKDAVRLERVATATFPMMFLPIDAEIEPAETFRAWLFGRLEPRKGSA